MTPGATAVVKDSQQVIEEALFLHLFVCVQLALWRRLEVVVRIIQVRMVFAGLRRPDVSFHIGTK